MIAGVYLPSDIQICLLRRGQRFSLNESVSEYVRVPQWELSCGDQQKSPCLSYPPLQGYLFGLLSAFLSAFAAVYTEWIMKRNNDSLYWQVCLPP